MRGVSALDRANLPRHPADGCNIVHAREAIVCPRTVSLASAVCPTYVGASGRLQEPRRWLRLWRGSYHVTVETKTERVAAVLQQRIADGIYPPGTAAPSTNQVAEEFGIAPLTARRALALLELRRLTEGNGQGRQRRIADPGRTAGPATALEYIRAAIAAGRRSGTELPSEADLVASSGFSRYSIRAAMAELARGGEVVNRPGRRRRVRGKTEFPLALYEKAMAAIREDVRNGTLPAGARMPTEFELCERFGMSRVTIRRALKELEEAGDIVRNVRRQRVVAEAASTPTKL